MAQAVKSFLSLHELQISVVLVYFLCLKNPSYLALSLTTCKYLLTLNEPNNSCLECNSPRFCKLDS